MLNDSFEELILARNAFAQFMKRYSSSRDPVSLNVRRELTQRLDVAEQRWERGRTGE